MKVTSKGFTKFVLGSVIASQLAACGTLIYPERRGQTGGQIDIGVAALNGIGLLLWFVPGVVAFGVDFVTGAIYLPGGTVAQLSDEEMKTMTLPDGRLDQEALQAYLEEQDYLDLAEVEGKTFVMQAYETPERLQRAVELSSVDQQYALKQ